MWYFHQKSVIVKFNFIGKFNTNNILINFQLNFKIEEIVFEVNSSIF